MSAKKYFKIIKCSIPEITSISVDTLLLEKANTRLGGADAVQEYIKVVAAQPIPEGMTRSRYVTQKLIEAL